MPCHRQAIYISATSAPGGAVPALPLDSPRPSVLAQSRSSEFPAARVIGESQHKLHSWIRVPEKSRDLRVRTMRQWANGAERETAQRPRRDRQLQPGRPRAAAQQSVAPASQMGAMMPHNNAARPATTGVHPEASYHELALNTAKLALTTAKQLRHLQATILRTLTVPDSTVYGPGLSALASTERGYNENAHAFAWAQLLLVLIDTHGVKAGEEITKPLHDHVANCATPDQLKDHIMECTLIRTWQGDSTLIRLATSSELRELCSIAVKLIVLAGGQVRYGPPPRGPMERATAACLSQLTQK